jgi:hypothetical protein
VSAFPEPRDHADDVQLLADRLGCAAQCCRDVQRLHRDNGAGVCRVDGEKLPCATRVLIEKAHVLDGSTLT